MQNKIYPCLWFDGKANEAARFYCSSFENTIIISETPLVLTIEMAGQKFMLLNGGPNFIINPSISFYVVCETEEETDKTWKNLLEGGSVLMPLDKYDWSDKYGWVQDKFGVNWQLSFGKMEYVGQKFSPVLMFAGEQNGMAEQAVHFYTSIFQSSSIVGILKYTNDEKEKEGNVKHAQFKLVEHVFMAMDSSMPLSFNFNEAISFVVNCDTQEEIDYYWEKLSADPEAVRSGWLKDKFGVSWQIVLTVMENLINDPSQSEHAEATILE